MFPGDLELEFDALFEDHKASCMVMEDMLALERAVYQSCTPAQLPLSDRQRFNRQKCVRLLQDFVASALRPTVQISMFSSWTSPMCGLNGEKTTFTSSTFFPWLPQSIFFLTDPG